MERKYMWKQCEDLLTEWEKLEPIGTRMFRAVPIGKEIMPNGKTRVKTIGKEFLNTRGYGDMEISIWVKNVMASIQDTELMELYTAIRAHMDTHIYFLHKEEQKKEWALSCMYNKAYEHWDDFQRESEPEEIIWM